MLEGEYLESLETMRARGGSWAVYQDQAMDSRAFGHMQFLRFGPGSTFETPPERCPDTPSGLGWKYVLIGTVNLATGAVDPIKSGA